MGKQCLHFFLAVYGVILLILADNEIYIKAWMSSNFGQIPLMTMELAALEHLTIRRHHFFSVANDYIHFKFVSYNDMHNI